MVGKTQRMHQPGSPGPQPPRNAPQVAGLGPAQINAWVRPREAHMTVRRADGAPHFQMRSSAYLIGKVWTTLGELGSLTVCAASR